MQSRNRALRSIAR